MTDFHANRGDRLVLSASVFGDLKDPGGLSGTVGPRAVDADDHIVYDFATGWLSFGAGGANAIAFAKLVAGTELAATGILIATSDALI